MKKTIRKPEDWQAFERLCKKLFGEVWNCPNTIKKNGRNGQGQSGVDIYGVPKGETSYYGIQCKGKDDYTQAQLTEKEIIDEIKKASTFQPPLKAFIIATSANKDVNVETFIRMEDVKSRKAGSFEIGYYAWEDLADLIEENRETFHWYVEEIQFRGKHEITVMINDQELPVIKPEYFRYITTYTLANRNLDDVNDDAVLGQFTSHIYYKAKSSDKKKQQFNYSWCRIDVTIINSGSSVLEDWEINLWIDETRIKRVAEEYDGEKDALMSLALDIAKLQYQNQTVFVDADNCSVIYKPLKPLIQKGQKKFSFWVQPKGYMVGSFNSKWQLLARDYNTEGTIAVNVEPQFQRVGSVIEVESESELKEKEESVEEKIADKV